MNEKDEYIIKKTSLIEWQKWLNQWKHQYDLTVITSAIEGDNITIALKRTGK